MKELCWSRGTAGIHLSNMLLVATLLISTHSQPVRRATLPAPTAAPSAAPSAVDAVLLVELGKEVSFSCTNESATQLVWHDGTLILTSSLHEVEVTGLASNNITITIPNITPYHYGNYKCFNSETGQLQATVTLMPSTSTVSTPLDLITEKLIEQRDDNVVISCDEGESLVKVDKEFHHIVITDDVLVVNLSEHQGKYLCLGEDNYPTMIYYVQLSGYRPLNITITPRSIHQVYPYQNIDCLVTGAPGPLTINWYYKSQPLSIDGRIYVEYIDNVIGYDSGLRLILNSSFPEYDSGVYVCVAKTDWEQAEQSLNINFMIGDDVYIAHWPRNTLAVGGSSINIKCYAVSKFDTELVFRFRKANHTLPPEAHGSNSKLTSYVTSSSLQLFNVTQSDNGVYSCDLLDIAWTDQRIGTLVVYKDPLHVISFIFNKTTDNISLSCNITIHEDFSDRLADIVVVFKLNNQTIAPELMFTASNNISAAAVVMDSGLYRCIATIDGVSKSLSVHIKGSGDDKGRDRLRNILLYGLAVVGFLCVVMFTLLFLICCRCPQRSSNAGYSNMVSKTKIGARLSTTSCASADFVFKKSLSTGSLLASSEWTIPYDALKFDCSLGSGAFGTVRKAFMMTGIGHHTPVAVKTLQCGEDDVSYKEAFEKEVMILHRVGSHQHIIGLFGVCTQANRYLLVMELASQGNLLDYVRHKRTDKLQPLSVQEVFTFARQIALGMEHLANQQCVHCDLAARNVLITGDFVLKISDFGLARKLYSGVYVKDQSKKVLLPIRWMAPECMTELKFSTQSDIWSYGVVLWEIYQLGAVPYHGISTHKLCSLLEEGLRLEKPQNCSAHHYQLMLSCWHDDPSCRPSFTDVLQNLSQFVITTATVYINWNDDGDYYSDCSDISVVSSVEDSCPVHGKTSTIRNYPTVKRNLKRMDSGLPDSPNDPFVCKKQLQCNKLEESEV